MKLVVTRTPLRVSLLGGGTDLPRVCHVQGGASVGFALGETIDVVVRSREGAEGPRFVVASDDGSFQTATSLEHIQHALVRESLRFLQIDAPLSVHILSGVAAGTGLGGSSSLTVGLVHALSVFKGVTPTKSELAAAAYRVEVERTGRPIGYQDHAFAAHGGFQLFSFGVGGAEATPLAPKRDVTRSLFLLRLDGTRSAAEVLSKLDLGAESNAEAMARVRASALELAQELENECKLHTIGEMLHRGWELKRSLGASNAAVDAAYDLARQHGAIGGKLLGAGQTGYLLLVVPEEERAAVITALLPRRLEGVSVDLHGSRVVACDE